MNYITLDGWLSISCDHLDGDDGEVVWGEHLLCPVCLLSKDAHFTVEPCPPTVSISLTPRDIEELRRWRREPLHSKKVTNRIIGQLQRILDETAKNP